MKAIHEADQEECTMQRDRSSCHNYVHENLVILSKNGVGPSNGLKHREEKVLDPKPTKGKRESQSTGNAPMSED